MRAVHQTLFFRHTEPAPPCKRWRDISVRVFQDVIVHLCSYQNSLSNKIEIEIEIAYAMGASRNLYSSQSSECINVTPQLLLSYK